jgi:hypothetical protein
VTELATAPHALYRFYDAAGMLLYVGITVDPGARHHWTCGWSWPGLRDGIAPTNRGRRQMKEVIYA